MALNSRVKGKVNELEVARAVGGKRIGYLHESKADVITPYAAYQVKADKRITWPELARELDNLETECLRDKNFLAVKKVRGRWFIIETLRQHIGR
jgi:hypothetical protein